MDYSYETSNGRNKRKHVTLTIREKLEIIELVESGKTSRQAIANRFGIGKSTVHDIHKRKDIIKNFALQNSSELSKRRRLDIRIEPNTEELFIYKDESNGIVEEETLVENFDHEEFDYNEEEYEIVYEPILCGNNEIVTKPEKIEISEKTNVTESNSKRKSKTLTLKEKYDILVQLDEGKSGSVIINKYGIGRTTLYDLKKQRQKIFDFIENSSGETRRTFKMSKYPEIEKGLFDWCNERSCYTEQQFFEKYKELFMQEKFKSTSVQSPFSGSWSWCKRFFERNPEYKKKLITIKDESIKDDSKGCQKELFNEMSPNRCNYLSINDKVQLIEDVENDRLNVEHEISRHPQVERELYDWCMQQQLLPDFESIAVEAYRISSSKFNPTLKWVKDFVDRHPDLSARLYDHSKSISDSSINEIFEEEGGEEDEGSVVENIADDSMELIDPQFIKPQITEVDRNKIELEDEYGNEYIVEELDDDDIQAVNYEDQEQIDVSSKRKEDETVVGHEEAINSLKILIKYSEQRGHNEISALLVEYQNILLAEENMQ